MVRNKKLSYKTNILDELNLRKKDQKQFWKLVNKLTPSTPNNIMTNTSADTWRTHFKSILHNRNALDNFVPDSVEDGPLDFEITLDEMLNASYILKENKASGNDSISNEMIVCLLKVKPLILLKLFNYILEQNASIDEWSISIFNPIHKDGAKSDPSNYRGISILSCLAKFFYSILNLRLTRFVDEKNILDKTQLGFRRSYYFTQHHSATLSPKKEQHILLFCGL